MLKAKAASEKQLEKYGDQAEAAAAMRACMAWDTIYEPEQMQVCTPVSRLWNIGWGGYVLFCWDTYFAAMLAATENKELAYSNLIAITGEKTESGFVPNFGSSNDGKSRDRSQPPVGAKALKEVYRRYREKWIVEYLFDDLLVWNRWWAANRQIKNGTLCWGSNPYEIRRGMHWETTGVDELLGAALESGLDNSPMYDGMEFDKETHLMRLSDVGLTGLYIMDCEALADLAEEIGRSEAAELRKRAEHTKDGLDTLWCEDSGMFLNRRTDTGELSPRTSPANFYALYSNRVTEAQAKKMMKNYFFNEKKFFGEFIMPSISRDDPAYADQEYWRGRIWAPMNFLAYMAIRQSGQREAAAVLAKKSEELLLKEWRLHGHVHENYSGDDGMGCGSKSSDKFYHWGALLALITLIENGHIDAPENPL